MNKLFSIATFTLLSAGAFAQNSTINQTSTTSKNVTDHIVMEKKQWSGKVADELANLPEDVQRKYQQAKNRADELGRQIQAIRVDSLTTDQQRAAIKELIAAKKAEAENRIRVAMESIEEYKTAHKNEIEAANMEVRARIEFKKEELKAKRAEIEKRIAEKRAEVDNTVAEN